MHCYHLAGETDRVCRLTVRCRKQKMKCVPASGCTDACRRCHRAGLSCVFVPRANAAPSPASPVLASLDTDIVHDGHFQSSVLTRLRVIEECLGLPLASTVPMPEPCEPILNAVSPQSEDDSDASLSQDPSLAPLWDAMATLQISCPSHVPRSVFRKSTVAGLFSSFHERMPGLHFMPDRQIFSSPQPVLLASMLLSSSTRGPGDVAELAPHYFTILCHAIANLSIPGSAISCVPTTQSSAPGEWAFQTVLGIVLAGLLTEASFRQVGIWISVAYRLLLEHCPAHGDDSSRHWRRLFSGLQIVDLEHASLHLSCPVIPIESPLSILKSSHSDQLYRLSRMMHAGLSHFTGRRLPTIWSCFTSDVNISAVADSTSCLTAVDAAVIRDWARQLDDWLVEFTSGSSAKQTSQARNQCTAEQQLDNRLIFRQYVLHRLVVLSIYHPARGCNLWARNVSLGEQYELLVSARATLKLHLHDDSIWANWDLVMITWAALIVIQAVEGGVGEADGELLVKFCRDVDLSLLTTFCLDLTNINLHLDTLRSLSGPRPSLCDTLVSRLEAALGGLQTPDATLVQHDQGYNSQTSHHENSADLDYSWQIFNQGSLQQFDDMN